MAEKHLLAYTTFPDRESASRAARVLVEEQLVACVNCFSVDSVYRWKGGIETAGEWALILKTRGSLCARLERRLGELHPYEVPAFVAFAIDHGAAAYLAWIDASTTDPDRPGVAH